MIMYYCNIMKIKYRETALAALAAGAVPDYARAGSEV